MLISSDFSLEKFFPINPCHSLFVKMNIIKGRDRIFAFGIERLVFKQNSHFKYCIYLRICQEILDRFWTLFYEFDIYAGHKICCLNTVFLAYLGKKLFVHYFKNILDHFCTLFFQF
jgi:hypothetical protein